MYVLYNDETPEDKKNSKVPLKKNSNDLKMAHLYMAHL